MFCANSWAQTTDSTQVDIVDVILGKKKFKQSNEKRTNKKIQFSLFPSPAGEAGGKSTVLTSINAAFFLGDPKETNLSNVLLLPYTDFSSRYGIYIKPTLWFPANKWNLIGDYRFTHFPQLTWGLGGNSKNYQESEIISEYIRIYQSTSRKIRDDLYVGMGYNFDYNYNILEANISSQSNLENYIPENDGSAISSGFTLNIYHDSRYNSINPTNGALLSAIYRINSKTFGSDQSYQTFYLDARKYVSIVNNKLNVTALRAYYWTIVSGDAPYLHLPATNWAPSSGIASRGFQAGRYRSNAMIYSEIEQRIQLTKNGLIGMVLFTNLASASEFKTQDFKYWKVGGGIGFRIKMNKYSNSNLACDFGFSDGYWSVWLNLGEMF